MPTSLQSLSRLRRHSPADDAENWGLAAVPHSPRVEPMFAVRPLTTRAKGLLRPRSRPSQQQVQCVQRASPLLTLANCHAGVQDLARVGRLSRGENDAARIRDVPCEQRLEIGVGGGQS